MKSRSMEPVKPKRSQSDGTTTPKEEEHVGDKEKPFKRTTRHSNVKVEGFYKFNSMLLRSMSSQSKAISPVKARKRSQKHAKSKKPKNNLQSFPGKRDQRKKPAKPLSH